MKMDKLDLLQELFGSTFTLEKHYYKEDLNDKPVFVAKLTLLKDGKKYVNAFGLGLLESIEEVIQNTEKLLYKKLINKIQEDFIIVDIVKEVFRSRYQSEPIFKPSTWTSTVTTGYWHTK